MPRAADDNGDSRNSHGKRVLNPTLPSKHDPDQPPQKRSRVSRACDQCRASREKCDGAQPSCQTCSQQTRPCTYHEQPKKRGIQPNYIRTLELTLAWLFEFLPASEHKLSLELSIPDSDAVNRIGAKDNTVSEKLHHAWRDSLVCRQIEQILTGSQVEAPGNVSFDTTDISIGNQLSISQSPVASQVEVASIIQPGPSISRLERPPIKLPANAWKLLEYYFAFTYSWLPITDKPAVLKLMYEYPPGGLDPTTGVSGEYAELWSIMALSAAQLSFHGESMTRLNAASLRDTACSLLPSEQGNLELGYIKALLLLGLIDLTHTRYLSAWVLVGTAVRLITYAQSPKSHLMSHPNSISSSDISQSLGKAGISSDLPYQRISLAALVLESAIASELHAPSHMRPEQLKTIGLLKEEGIEEWQTWSDPLLGPNSGRTPARSISTFNQLVRETVQARDSEVPNLVSLLTLNPTRPNPNERLQPNVLVTQYLMQYDQSPEHSILATETVSNLPMTTNSAFVSVPHGPASGNTSMEDTPGIMGPMPA